MTNPRPDPAHCLNGHDLSICGTYAEHDHRRGTTVDRCRACLRKRTRERDRKRSLMRKNATGGPMREGQGGATSTGDG